MSDIQSLLDFGQVEIEKLMTAGARIVWDPEGSGDDDFDYDTGRPIVPIDDAAYVYDERSVGAGGRPLVADTGLGGMAYIGPIQATRSVGLQIGGGAHLTTVPYEIWIPRDAPQFGAGAVVEVITSARDTWLPDRQFVVRSVEYDEMAVMRVLISEERERAPD